jgi:hypothetical protein
MPIALRMLLLLLSLGFILPTARAAEADTNHLPLLDPTSFPTTFTGMDFTRTDSAADSARTDLIRTAFNNGQRWSFELLGTGLGDVTNRHVQMGGLDTGVGLYVFDTVAIQMNLTGYGFSEGRSDGAAVGITLGIRHHILNINNNSIFLDVAGGEIEASNNLPYGGTHLNNTIQFGIGVAHPLAENLSLVAGVRYYHISNASSEGGDRNPSVNAIQGVVGLLWRF